jgi:hypothetical protein
MFDIKSKSSRRNNGKTMFGKIKIDATKSHRIGAKEKSRRVFDAFHSGASIHVIAGH